MYIQSGSSYIRCERILINLLRTTMLIVFGLANLNNGLTPYDPKDKISEELHRTVNQNLIMSPSSHAMASAYTQQSSDTSYPSFASKYSDSSSRPEFPQSSRSSITSFDSINVIDERHHQQQQQQQQQQQFHQQQQHFKSQQLAKDIIAQSKHKSLDDSRGNSAAAMNGGEGNRIQINTSSEGGDDIYTLPMYFGTDNSTVVTTQIGAIAHIPCAVHHIGDGVVSWIRRKDYHLLTVGLTTYSSDERFSAVHIKHSEDWTLQIKFVQVRDAGVYECQVSTHPPTSIFLHLNVVEARAEISGPPIRYLTPGSTLRLQCRVVQNTEASEFIFWYHDNRMINYDVDRGINVSTDPDYQSSELTILRTRREHSGNYTCVASNTQPASVLVHIFKGDNPAAMYVGSATTSYQMHLNIQIALEAIFGYRILYAHRHIRVL